jgi:hypothetical protein
VTADRQSHDTVRGSILALLNGCLLGFLSVYLAYPGFMFASVLLVVLATYYAHLRRIRHLGFLFVGAGGVPGLLMGRVIVIAMADRSVTIFADTLLALGVALTAVSVGAALILATFIIRHGDPQRTE